MARISSYPFDTNITGDDAWIGTDSSNRSTKQFTATAVANFINLTGKLSIGGQMNFKWSDTENGGAGTISRTGGDGSGLAFNSITQMRISITETSNENVVAFLTYIIGKPILLGQGDQISSFGHYTIASYAVDPGDANYYIANLTYIGGNGVIAAQDTIYTIVHFNITSGGTDVGLRQNFTTSNQWVINNTTGKADCSVTLIDTNNEIIFGCVDYTSATTITVDFDSNVAGSSFLN
jgi:hypothetical protein|tara:strand:- start:13 stop:720 length:708 start_codon:yes stop_codon:yes gene_type:complete